MLYLLVLLMQTSLATTQEPVSAADGVLSVTCPTFAYHCTMQTGSQKLLKLCYDDRFFRADEQAAHTRDLIEHDGSCDIFVVALSEEYLPGNNGSMRRKYKLMRADGAAWGQVNLRLEWSSRAGHVARRSMYDPMRMYYASAWLLHENPGRSWALYEAEHARFELLEKRSWYAVFGDFVMHSTACEAPGSAPCAAFLIDVADAGDYGIVLGAAMGLHLRLLA